MTVHLSLAWHAPGLCLDVIPYIMVRVGFYLPFPIYYVSEDYQRHHHSAQLQPDYWDD